MPVTVTEIWRYPVSRRVVHVSTTVALTRYAGSGPDLPLGDIELPYAQSKIASEEVARRLQDTAPR